ncbi:MAG: gamma-glutamyl-gamma-aminobutyrate hydrolase family protein [Bacillota bacterium]
MLPIIGISCCIDHEGLLALSSPRRLYYVPRDYAEAVERAGGLPVMVPFVDGAGVLEEVLRIVDGLVMTGGGRLPDFDGPLPGLRQQHPERYQQDARLIRGALELGMPLLGICRGHQMINEVLGGTLALQVAGHDQAPLLACRPFHRIRVEAASRLERLAGAGELDVNSLHRQAVTRPGRGLRAVAWGPDDAIEAVEGDGDQFVLGLQFHPELMPGEPFSQRIWQGFCRAARDYRERRRRWDLG